MGLFHGAALNLPRSSKRSMNYNLCSSILCICKWWFQGFKIWSSPLQYHRSCDNPISIYRQKNMGASQCCPSILLHWCKKQQHISLC